MVALDKPHDDAVVINLPADTTADNAIQAIVEAAHGKLATACSAMTTTAAVRVINPMRQGEYADVKCQDIMSNTSIAVEPMRDMQAAESTGDHATTAETAQSLGPLLCGILGVIETGAMSRACSDWRGTTSQVCPVGGFATGMGWACVIAF
jgi:uncharacterized protein YdbL (DUF1318 family)